jgi:hypothetical protein
MTDLVTLPLQAVEDMANCIKVQNEVLEQAVLTQEQEARCNYIAASMKRVSEIIKAFTK